VDKARRARIRLALMPGVGRIRLGRRLPNACGDSEALSSFALAACHQHLLARPDVRLGQGAPPGVGWQLRAPYRQACRTPASTPSNYLFFRPSAGNPCAMWQMTVCCFGHGDVETVRGTRGGPITSSFHLCWDRDVDSLLLNQTSLGPPQPLRRRSNRRSGELPVQAESDSCIQQLANKPQSLALRKVTSTARKLQHL